MWIIGLHFAFFAGDIYCAQDKQPGSEGFTFSELQGLYARSLWNIHVFCIDWPGGLSDNLRLANRLKRTSWIALKSKSAILTLSAVLFKIL